MVAYLLYAVAALYLGVLTSISPCPLATNIAAISYVGRKVGDSRSVIAAGFLYTLGRCLLYLALAVLLATTAMSIPAVSVFLQKYMHIALGPIFLLLGLFLVGLITTNLGGATMSEGMQKRIDAMGVWGAPLGSTFCRVLLPDLGGMVLRPACPHHGIGGWGDYDPSRQGGHQPSRGDAARQHGCSAVHLRRWHRAASIVGCLFAGLQCQVDWQDL